MANTDKAWIVGRGGSVEDGVVFWIVRGTDMQVKKYMLDLATKARDADLEGWDFGTEKIEEVEERFGSFYSFACFFDYHVDFEATPYEDLTLIDLYPFY